MNKNDNTQINSYHRIFKELNIKAKLYAVRCKLFLLY